MLPFLVRATFRSTTTRLPASAAFGSVRAPVTQAAVARYAGRFSSTAPYAVDGPDGEHDFEDIEEHMDGVNRIINVASVTEDADAITEMHEAVFDTKNNLFAVDAPDGEHDLEEVEEHLSDVDRIIDEASVLEDPLEVEHDHEQQEETRKKLADQVFENSKY